MKDNFVINIANLNIGANSNNVVVNTLTVTFIDARLKDNNTKIKNMLKISIIFNCPKEIGRMGILKVFRLDNMKIENIES